MPFGLISLTSMDGGMYRVDSGGGGGPLLSPYSYSDSGTITNTGGSSGSGLFAPAVQVPAYSAPAASGAPGAPAYQAPSPYVSVYDLKRRQLGEGGEYTALDYPVLRFLHEGERLETAPLANSSPAAFSLKEPLIAAAILLLLLK